MPPAVLAAGLCALLLAPPAQGQMPSRAMTSSYSPESYKARETHGAVEVRVLGDGAQRAYLFVPAQPRPVGQVPVVLLHHGWLGMNPLNFGAVIDHLARSGHAVIYPVYQESDKTPPQVVTDNAGAADRRALDLLATSFGLQPAPGRTLYYGFSMGVAISLNLALNPQRYGLPPPDALVLTAPGDAYHVAHGELAKSIIGPVQLLPPALPIAILTGEADPIGLPTARRLMGKLCHIPRERRVLMVLPSDEHQGRKVTAGHGSPGAPDSRYDFDPARRDVPATLPGRPAYEASGSLNQLDFHGYWKVIDGVLDSLRLGELQPVVFGLGLPDQLSLGAWPDGTPFKPLRLEDPCG
jgi:dienelactone hydrolase